MKKQELGTFIMGIGAGIALTTALSGIYCVYFKKKRDVCPFILSRRSKKCLCETCKE